MAAGSSRAFGDSVGITVRFSWIDTAYGNFDAVEARVRELGVRFVSDGFCSTCPYQIDHMNRFAALGIKANIGVSGLNEGLPAMDQSLQVIRDKLRSSVISLSAPNEPDISGDPLWAQHARAYQEALYARVKNDPALRHLPVLGPPLVRPESRTELGDISANLDRGNIHPYPAGTMPMTHLDLEKFMAAAVSGNKPLVATETGYHTDITDLGPHRGAPEAAVAQYTPRSVLEAFRQGIERTYLYQLMDAWTPAQAQARGTSAAENSFGLLRYDFSPKPAFISLRNLLRVVDGDSDPVASPGGLRVGLEGAGPDVRQLLLRSADGTYALVLWRQTPVWNRDTLTEVVPTPDPVDVVLGERVVLAQRFDPVGSDAETARWAEPQRIPVALAGAPVVLRLTPPGVQPAVAPVKGRIKRARRMSRQRLRKNVTIRVSCRKRCAVVSAKGRLLVKRGKRARSFKLGHARKATRGPVVTLHLKIPARARRAALKSLKRGGRVRARVTVTARSPKGAKLRSGIRTVPLRR